MRSRDAVVRAVAGVFLSGPGVVGVAVEPKPTVDVMDGDSGDYQVRACVEVGDEADGFLVSVFSVEIVMGEFMAMGEAEFAAQLVHLRKTFAAQLVGSFGEERPVLASGAGTMAETVENFVRLSKVRGPVQ